MAITEEMTMACYEAAKEIYSDRSAISEKAESVALSTGMNAGSAKDYIRVFFFMISGERMKRAMAEKDVRYYFTRIYSDYGMEGLQNTVNSLQEYLDYDRQNHSGLQKTEDEFTEEYLK